ncbi:hypothetical protein C8R43DRAFT_589305 [Mycena crocata]|nr:hypothetical protein C8R43DRAFT_589305 [Mycena crocata]
MPNPAPKTTPSFSSPRKTEHFDILPSIISFYFAHRTVRTQLVLLVFHVSSQVLQPPALFRRATPSSALKCPVRSPSCRRLEVVHSTQRVRVPRRPASFACLACIVWAFHMLRRKTLCSVGCPQDSITGRIQVARCQDSAFRIRVGLHRITPSRAAQYLPSNGLIPHEPRPEKAKKSFNASVTLVSCHTTFWASIGRLPCVYPISCAALLDTSFSGANEFALRVWRPCAFFLVYKSSMSCHSAYASARSRAQG